MTGALALALALAGIGVGDEPAADGEASAPESGLVPDPGPDPVATHPAGLDPRTLCRAGAPCEPAQTTAPAPLLMAVAIGGAQLAYDHHPTRLGGSEISARLELWRELAWSAHVMYLADAIDERSPAGVSTTTFHDLAFGGHVTLPFTVPSWLAGAAHVLSGDGSGNGNAFYGAIGARLAGIELELGASSMQLDPNTGPGTGPNTGPNIGSGTGPSTGASVSLRAARTGRTFGAWLELDAGAAAIAGMRTTQLGGCAGIDLRWPRWSLDVEGLFGDRALAVTDRGEIAETVAETLHTSGRAVLRVELGAHLQPYAGVVARTATTSQGIDYVLLIGFAGISFRF